MSGSNALLSNHVVVGITCVLTAAAFTGASPLAHCNLPSWPLNFSIPVSLAAPVITSNLSENIAENQSGLRVCLRGASSSAVTHASSSTVGDAKTDIAGGGADSIRTL